jgi:predicted MFS family arabinose efflux permease
LRINRWGILAVLFVARLCAGTQFQSAGSVAPFLARDFAVGYDRIGTLIGIYMVPGLILAIPAGFLGRRFGDRTVVAAATGLMVLSGIVSGLAESYAALVAGRLLGGAGTAFLFVLLIKMLSDWFADKDLFLGMSIFIVGWPVGIASAQATQGLIAEQASWNAVFLSTAAASAVGLVAIAAFYRPPPGPVGAPSRALPSGLGGTEKWLLAIAGLMWLLINGAYMVVLGFGPVLLIEQGATVVESGRIVSLMSWVFLFALPAGGYIATRYRIPDVTAVGGLAVCVVVGALIPFTEIPVVTFAAFGIAFAIAVPVVSSLPALVLRPENRGPGFGIFQVWYFAGAAFMPMGAGYLHDLTGGATISMLCAAGMMFAVLCLHVVFRSEQRRLA